jgi:hypothetical protein
VIHGTASSEAKEAALWFGALNLKEVCEVRLFLPYAATANVYHRRALWWVTQDELPEGQR